MDTYTPSHINYRTSAITALVLMFWLLTGCAAQPTATPAPTATPEPTATAETTPTAEPTATTEPTATIAGPTDVVQEDAIETRNEAAADEQAIGAEDVPAVTLNGPAETYTDEYGGYALDYPAGWLVEAGPRNTVSVTSAAEVPADSADLETGQTLVQIVPVEEDDGDFEAVLESQRQFIADSAGELTDDSEIELTAASQAHRLTYTLPDTGDVVLYVVTVNERDFIINGYGDLDMVTAIVSTLRPQSN